MHFIRTIFAKIKSWISPKVHPHAAFINTPECDAAETLVRIDRLHHF